MLYNIGHVVETLHQFFFMDESWSLTGGACCCLGFISCQPLHFLTLNSCCFTTSILMIPFGVLQVIFFFLVLMTVTSYIVQQAATIKMFFKFRNYHNYPTQSMPMENGQTMGMTNEE